MTCDGLPLHCLLAQIVTTRMQECVRLTHVLNDNGIVTNSPHTMKLNSATTPIRVCVSNTFVRKIVSLQLKN